MDDDPTAVNDAATVVEDSAANTIDVLANDTDPDAGPNSVISATDPANGTVVITGGGTGLTYQPDANYCNDPPGTTPDTFTYTLNGGSIGTVAVTVTCVDDPPTAVGDTATVPEDSAATPIAVLANDTDIDAGPMTIASASDPTNGTVVLTGGSAGAHTGLTYQPDAQLLQQPARHDPGHVHLHPQRRLGRHCVRHRHLRRRRAGRGGRRRHRDRGRRGDCDRGAWPTTPTSTAAR